jgi:8-oxo-dGTP diphosphatase
MPGGVYVYCMTFKTEAEFLAAYDPSAFERPSVATDIVVLTVQDNALRALLIERVEHPHRGRYMAPGGFVGINEDLHDAATRLLSDKTGVTDVFLEQLFTFGSPQRDPRMRVITVAHIAIVPAHQLAHHKGRLFELKVDWSGETGGPARAIDETGTDLSLAFDHADLLGMAVQRIRGRLNYSPIAYSFLPDTFTLRALQNVWELILGHRLNKPSFRRKVLGSGELVPTGQREELVGHRPAELYRFSYPDNH